VDNFLDKDEDVYYCEIRAFIYFKSEFDELVLPCVPELPVKLISEPKPLAMG
jgi:hypothetical protein